MASSPTSAGDGPTVFAHASRLSLGPATHLPAPSLRLISARQALFQARPQVWKLSDFFRNSPLQVSPVMLCMTSQLVQFRRWTRFAADRLTAKWRTSPRRPGINSSTDHPLRRTTSVLRRKCRRRSPPPLRVRPHVIRTMEPVAAAKARYCLRSDNGS